MTSDNNVRSIGADVCGLETCDQYTPNVYPSRTDTLTRCIRCGHPLSASRSVTRGLGPTCWQRMRANQLGARRGALRAKLDAVRGRVDQMGTYALTVATAALDAITDTLSGGAR